MALFGKKTPAPTPLEQLPQELTVLIQKAQEERTKISSLLGRTKGSVEKLEKLDAPLSAVADRTEEISRRLKQMEDRFAQLATLAERLDQLGQRAAVAEQTHSAMEDRVGKINADVADVMAVAEGLQESVAAATQIRAELQAALGPGGTVAEMRGKVDELRTQFLTYGHDVDHTREQQEALKRAQDEAMGRVMQVRDEALRTKDQMDEAGIKIARYEVALANLAKVQELAPRAEQDVQALNALADHVAHKTRILEKQREVVDRAAAQAARLDDVVWDLDARLKKLQQDSARIKKTQEALEDLQDLVRRVEVRTTEVRTAQQASEKDSAMQVARLASIKDEIKGSLDRFDIEKRGLDAVNQRIADLRSGLTEFERRVHDLQGTGQGIAQAQARADELSARLATMASDVMRVSEQAERARNIETTLERSDAATGRLATRVEGLQAAFPDLQQLQRDVAELKGTRETVLDALDRLRGARAEMERAQAAQGETRAFVAGVDQTVSEVRQKMAALEERSGMVERVAQYADAALSAQRELESRREFLEQLERRVAQLGALSADLEQRAKMVEDRRANFVDLESRAEALRGRLDDADRRFSSVAARAGESEQVEARITEVGARAQSAEERMAALARGLEDAAQREAKLAELSQRIDRVGRELEQRERTLQQAAENLERAAAARQSAMEAAQALEEQGRKLGVSIAGAEAQTDRVAQLTDQLEARAGGLRLVEKRLTAFEEKLAQLERAEQQIERSMDGLGNRAKSVDAVRDELTRIFELVENTMADVRAISTARQEVHTARTSLDEVLQRAARVDQLAAGIDRRQREIELAEQRIARLDALLVDVRASLE
ncbi:MAG: hypothetical protein HY700_02440, partial [Gemmatimonadetes bacterium]|nr:hypothetical protein [Gemmatimonadota bacterium]